jgi:hypothetical protein
MMAIATTARKTRRVTAFFRIESNLSVRIGIFEDGWSIKTPLPLKLQN